MSTCISSHGEYSSHELDATFTCTLCGVLDEDGLRAELAKALDDRDFHKAAYDQAQADMATMDATLDTVREELAATKERLQGSREHVEEEHRKVVNYSAGIRKLLDERDMAGAEHDTALAEAYRAIEKVSAERDQLRLQLADMKHVSNLNQTALLADLAEARRERDEAVEAQRITAAVLRQVEPVVEAATAMVNADRADNYYLHTAAWQTLQAAVDALPSSSDGAGQTDEAKFLVWSHEHDAWWGPNHAGYYDKLNSAGVYTRDEAEKICNPLNWTRDGRPHEVMVECPPNFEVFKVARQLREQLGDMVREATMRALETRCVRCTTLDDADSKAAECRCRTNCGSWRCPEPRATASVSAPAEETA